MLRARLRDRPGTLAGWYGGAAGASGRLSTPAHLWETGSAWIRAEIGREVAQRRLFPWLAVAFGLGILTELTGTDGTPWLGAPLLAAAALAALLPVLGARPVATALLGGTIAGLLGFAAAVYRVESVASPVLARTMIAPMTGVVEVLDEREEGARLVVRVASIKGLDAAVCPSHVRVSYKRSEAIRPGDTITATARLLPPPEAARPGGYDFARDAWFRGIGAVGSLVGRIEVRRELSKQPWSLRLAAGIDDARNALTRRITDANGGQAGAVAAALVTGKRSLIDAHTNDVLRAAGIYHVVSISGLHMVLAAGVVFWLVRAGLALVPRCALTLPVKKIAAGVAKLGVSAYCVFSGWDVAAERSLLMTLVMLGAILVDRPALSMRNLALSAILCLAREPEALLGPSFQMSFAAVAGLIAVSPLLEHVRLRAARAGAVGRLAASAATAIAGTLATTLIAQIATAPFATYHFQNVQPFGVVGNALTLPLVSLAVMPAAVLGILAYPFALDRPVWWAMGLAVHGMLWIAEWIAGFSRAVVVVPAFAPAVLALLSAAVLLATLPSSRLRWLAILPVGAGLSLAAVPVRFDIYVDRDGAGAAVRGADGRLAILGKPPGFVLEQWLKADGDARRADAMPGPGGACDRLGCTLRAADGRWVALVQDKRAFLEDCARADIVISRAQAPKGCAARTIIDRGFLAAHGAIAIRLEGDGQTVVAARGPDWIPPWRVRPPKKAADPQAMPMARTAPAPAPAPERAIEKDSDPGPDDTGDAPPAQAGDAPAEPLQ